MNNPIMIFNDQINNDIYLLRGRSKSAFHPIKRDIRKNGSSYRIRKNDRGLLTIQQPIGFKTKTDEKHIEVVEKLTNWLVTDDWTRLSFSDEPGRIYLAVLQEGIDLEKIAWLREGTLSFVAKETLGQQEIINVTSTTTTDNIVGQEKTPWIVEVTFTQNTSSFELTTNQGLYVLLGYQFIAGDNLVIKYDGREVLLNGHDLRSAVRLKTNYELLQPGTIDISASHDCTLTYDERFH
ncbi:putative phage tail component, N-terminal domain-containing protein [Halolactibacillus halophilus]|uniref:Putative phage tail component, N-terminal domain-containing protein n=1 Tax=Halolactibacillus halophilus TaxID=306540 RepID=A0A1I5T3J0_9BACI|nr:distal tail protein Dit [Halolactibacillus halophilus]GEM02938.1 hypothetical protein HHA03_24700 [Halolactibacillus halophilus]SFP77605.1 putative phage tail component, N-terminal domain-containing protein [Halolactibacillus halophilus]